MKRILLMFLLMFTLVTINNSCTKPQLIKNDSDVSLVTNDTVPTNSALDYYSCGSIITHTLRTSSNVNVGTVTITNNFEFIEITISTTGNWVLDNTRMYVGYESNVPTNNSGSIKVSSFPYSIAHPWDTDNYKIRISRGEVTNGIPYLMNNIVIIVASEVLRINKNTCYVYESKCATTIGTTTSNSCGCTPNKIYYLLQHCVEV